MSYHINSIAYPAKAPIYDLIADSLDDLAALENVGEGSKCTVDGTTYVYDEVGGWQEEGSGGGGSGGTMIVNRSGNDLDKTWKEIHDFSGVVMIKAVDADTGSEYYEFVKSVIYDIVSSYPYQARVVDDETGYYQSATEDGVLTHHGGVQ